MLLRICQRRSITSFHRLTSPTGQALMVTSKESSMSFGGGTALLDTGDGGP